MTLPERFQTKASLQKHLPPLPKPRHLRRGQRQHQRLLKLNRGFLSVTIEELLVDHPFVGGMLVHHEEPLLGLGQQVKPAKAADQSEAGKPPARALLFPGERTEPGKGRREGMRPKQAFHRPLQKGHHLLGVHEPNAVLPGIGINQHLLGGQG